MIALSSKQIRDWDQYSIRHEPIASIDLVERAATACFQWMGKNHLPGKGPCYIFCSKGNNAADGLALARLLTEHGQPVELFILEFGQPGTADFQQNLQRIQQLPLPVHYLQEAIALPMIPPGCWVIDALLGTGINRLPEGRMAALIAHINASGNPVLSIDLPSGLLAEVSTPSGTSIKATITLSFQCFKPALLFAENASAFGQLEILDIGLKPAYLNSIDPLYEGIDENFAKGIFKPRPSHAHKGNFGHALLLAGSSGKMGAALLAGKACLRSGPGLLSFYSPEADNGILQTGLQEAMCQLTEPDYGSFAAIGCGPGWGTGNNAAAAVQKLITTYKKPLVLDADALNLMAKYPDWKKSIPAFSILTPHPKEFDRLEGRSDTESERWEKAKTMAIEQQWIVLLKGHHTLVAMPGGKAYFNTSGNASMAKGGSGDVLTGMLTGLLAHGYAPEQAALLGVYLHGRAGELASRVYGMESVLASDIIDQIGAAFKEIGA